MTSRIDVIGQNDPTGEHYEHMMDDSRELNPPENKPEWECDEPPEIDSKWHHYNDNTYTVIGYANERSEDARYPFTIIYKGDNGNIWCRPLSEWYRSFTPFKSDKEKWVESVQEFYNLKLQKIAPNQATLEEVYDALISGELPIPEVKHDKSN